jgi:hypothetical protein
VTKTKPPFKEAKMEPSDLRIYGIGSNSETFSGDM